jgi:type IV pilus assembly protein PilC
MAKTKQQDKRRKAVHLAYKESEYFTENLALLLKSAVPISEIIDSLAEGARSRLFKKALAGIQEDISAGYGLSDALDRSGIIGGQTLALIKLGEVSGHLVENLQLAAQQEAKRHAFRAKVRSALIYPSFVIGLTLVVGVGVAWFLLPRLAETFSQLGVALPAISRILINLGIFLKEHGLVAVPSAAAAIALLGYILFFAPGTRNIGKTLLFHLPGIGRLIREVEVAQFGYLLGTLMNAGLTVTQSLKLLESASSTPQYQKLYQHLGESIDNGYTFKESMTNYKHVRNVLPVSIRPMIVAGERSGSLPEVLLTIGAAYEQKSDITTQNLETIIEPILLVMVAIGVLLVAIAVILPIYSLVGGLNA